MAKTTTEAERRMNAEQAIANCKIEGFVPDQEFLDSMERVIKGEATTDQIAAEIAARAKAGVEAARKL